MRSWARLSESEPEHRDRHQPRERQSIAAVWETAGRPLHSRKLRLQALAAWASMNGDRMTTSAQHEAMSVDTALDAVRRAPFAMNDILRRVQGEALGAWGWGPTEHPYKIVAAGSYWSLRGYGGPHTVPSMLIVSAPIKRPYIWDLAPSASAIGYSLEHGQRVHLLEWRPASHSNGNHGLEEYARAIGECVARVSGEGTGGKPFLIGHSLGGTLAAIYGALASKDIRAVALLGAPLCFQPETSQFRDSLVSLVPPTSSEAEPYPGSLVSQLSALASPDTFIWSRLMDAIYSAADPHAIDIHARVERWALDEVPLPGKLFHQVIEWLYRENRFCRGTLTVNGARVGPASLSAPTLAVVNTADEVAPMASVKPFLDAMPASDARMIVYAGEIGVSLQHLGILVGRQALARVWPEIISWLKAQA